MLRKRYTCSSMTWAKILTSVLLWYTDPVAFSSLASSTRSKAFLSASELFKERILFFFYFNLSCRSSQWTFSSWLIRIYFSPSNQHYSCSQYIQLSLKTREERQMSETLLIEKFTMITVTEGRRQEDKIQSDLNLWWRKPIRPKHC